MITTTLKLIALALMFIDHIYEFIPGTPPIFTILGRISAPVFFFCTVWGFHYTRNRRVYLTRMYLCSALMGLLDFLLNTSLEQPVVPCYNNIFSTLFMVCLFVCLWERGDQAWKKILWTLGYLAINAASLILARLVLVQSGLTAMLENLGVEYTNAYTAVIGLLPNILTCEGSFYIVIMGLVLHFCKGSRKKLSWGYGIYCLVYFLLLLPPVFGNALEMSPWQYLFRDAIQWMQVFALPLMLCYNGQRGKNLKYLFYGFYPAYIALLYYLGNYIAV